MRKNTESNEELSIRFNTVGTLIREFRQRGCLSQKALAKRLGYSSSQFISNWERGESSPPVNILPKIIKILDIPPRRLLSAIMKCQSELFALRQKETQRVFATLKRK